MIISDIENGSINPSIQITDELKELMEKYIKPNKKRGEELKVIFKSGSDFPFALKVWPNLLYLCGIGTTIFSRYDEIIRNFYTDNKVSNIFCGISSCEGIYSVPYALNTEDTALIPKGCFLEFVDLSKSSQNKNVETKMIHELEEGKKYEVILTNLAGLYRYRLKDTILVKGKYLNTPTIIFLNRVEKNISMTGEKIIVSDMDNFIKQIISERKLDINFYAIYLDYYNMRYNLYLEPAKGFKFDVKTFEDYFYKKLIEKFEILDVTINKKKQLEQPKVFILKEGFNLDYLYNKKKNKKTSIVKINLIINDDEISFFNENLLD